MLNFYDPAAWRDAVVRLTKLGVPALAMMSVIMTLYLAPTKDTHATILAALLGVAALATGQFQLRHLQVLKVLWPLGFLGL